MPSKHGRLTPAATLRRIANHAIHIASHHRVSRPDIAEAPSEWMGDLEEQMSRRREALEEAVRAENELLKSQRDILKEMLDLEVRRAEHALKMAELNRPVGQERGTEEWRKSEEALAQKRFEKDEKVRQAALKSAQDTKDQADADAAKAKGEAEAAQQRIDGLTHRRNLEQAAAASTGSAEGLEREASMFHSQFADDAGRLSKAFQEEYDRLMASAKAQRAQAAKYQQLLQARDKDGALVIPAIDTSKGETIDSVKADLQKKLKNQNDTQVKAIKAKDHLTVAEEDDRMAAEKNRKELEKTQADADHAVKEREKKRANELAAAEREAELERAQLSVKERESVRDPKLVRGSKEWQKQEDDIAHLKLQAALAEAEKRKGDALAKYDEGSRQGELAAEQYQRSKQAAYLDYGNAKNEHELATQKAQEARQKKINQGELDVNLPDAGGLVDPAALAAANKGLNEQYNATKDEKARTKLSAMLAALNDGKGDQGNELAIVQEMLSRFGQDKGQNASLLNQALKMMEDQQAEGSRMQQAIIGALRGMVGKLADIADAVNQQQADISSIRIATRP